MIFSFVSFNRLSSFLPRGGPFLESPDNYQHRKGRKGVVVSILYYFKIEVSNDVLQKLNMIKLSLDKTKWTGLLARNGVCEFRETAPVQGNFRTGPTSPRLPFVALSPSEMSYRREVHPDCCAGARIVFWYAILQLHRVNEELQFVSVWNRPPVKTRTLEVRMYNFRQT